MCCVFCVGADGDTGLCTCLYFAGGMHIIDKNNMFHSFFRPGNHIFLQIFKANRGCALCMNMYCKHSLFCSKTSHKQTSNNKLARILCEYKHEYLKFCSSNQSENSLLCTVKPVLRGHLWDKEKVAM
jgi:hypothetical protein